MGIVMMSIRVVLCIGSMLLLCSSGLCSAAPDASIPRHIFFENPEKIALTLSPDGQQLAYVAPYEGVMNIWLTPVAAIDWERGTLLTRSVHRPITTYGWSYDNRHIWYLQDTNGDENDHLYCIDTAAPAVVRDLTPFADTKVAVIGQSPRYPDDLLIVMNRNDAALFDVYRLTISTGACELVAQNGGATYAWFADRDLQVRARIDACKRSSRQTLYSCDGSGWRELLSVTGEDAFLEGSCSPVVGFSTDGESIYLVSSIDADTRRLIRMDIATGKYVEIAADTRYDLVGVLFDPEVGSPEIAFWEKERLTYQPLSDGIRSDLELIELLLHDTGNGAAPAAGHISDIQRTTDGMSWLIGVTSDRCSYRTYLYRKAERRLELLCRARPKIDAYQLAPMEPIAYTARDGLRIEGYLTQGYLSQGQCSDVEHSGAGPLLLCVHGGPVQRDTWGYNGWIQFFASRGISCLQVNYRGSSGYGKAFTAAGYHEWGAKMQDDLTDAVAWAVAQGIADPKRIGIFGGSYGGYAALAAVAFTPDLFCCAVDLCGPCNLITLLKSIPAYWSLSIAEKLIGSLTDEPFLQSRSPLFYVDRITKPVLIAQGAYDVRVKQAEADQIVAALADKGLAHEYLLFPDEGHGLARPENRLRFAQAVETFFAQHLGSSAQ